MWENSFDTKVKIDKNGADSKRAFGTGPILIY